jgi:hypothetical protein
MRKNFSKNDANSTYTSLLIYVSILSKVRCLTRRENKALLFLQKGRHISLTVTNQVLHRV